MKHNYLRQCAFALFILPLFLHAQTAGTPDFSFGQGGQVVIGNPSGDFYGGPTVLQPDGKLIVAGYFFGATDTSYLVLTRLLPDGTPDLSYGPNGQVFPNLAVGYGGIYRMALTSTGQLIVAGDIDQDGYRAAFVARLNADGSIDSTFGQGGVAIFNMSDDEDSFSALLIKPDGKILLGGSTYNASSSNYYDLLLVQLLPNGLGDPVFGFLGVTTANFVAGLESILSLALQADGKIVAAGGNAVNSYDMQVVRFMPDGSIDTYFGNNGIVIDGDATREEVSYSVAVQSDQKIVFCGTSFENGSNNGETTLFRLLPDGSFDPSFGTNGKVFTEIGSFEFARALVIQPDGKILVGAESIDLNNDDGGWLWVMRYNTDGSLDPTFGNAGIVQNPRYDIYPETSGILLQPDGKIVLSGTDGHEIFLWRYLNDDMVGLHESTIADFQLQCAPNLVRDVTTLNWVLDAPAEMQCELYDAQGRLVETLLSPTFFPSGAHAQELRLDGALPSGQYFLMVHVGDNRQVLRITKM